MQWQRPGRVTVVVQTGGVYTVVAAVSSDNGTYECVAMNFVSQIPISESITLQVIGVC
jgi:hypothetical protein